MEERTAAFSFVLIEKSYQRILSETVNFDVNQTFRYFKSKFYTIDYTDLGSRVVFYVKDMKYNKILLNTQREVTIIAFF